jgi:hypothetical protein
MPGSTQFRKALIFAMVAVLWRASRPRRWQGLGRTGHSSEIHPSVTVL